MRFKNVQQQESELQSSNPLPIINITKLRADYFYFTPMTGQDESEVVMNGLKKINKKIGVHMYYVVCNEKNHYVCGWDH